jgi:hypothetical protein
MQRIVRRGSFLLLATVCVLGLTGCGKKGVVVKGKVIFPPNATATSEQLVTVGFTPADKGVLSSTAKYNADDNTFEATGLDGKGLIPGKYTITVSVVETPKAGGGNKTREEMLKELGYKDLNKKYDPASSPLSFEITSSTQSITIDLSAGTVTSP